MANELSALFGAVASWAAEVKNAHNVGADGTLWCEVTEANEHFDAPVTVTMNATKAELDGIPPFTAKLTNDKYFPGIMALVHPYGGMMIGAGDGDEDRLIQHFNAQARPQPAAA
ncbi:hypothetical protein G6M50_06290 [Agrobacterium rhizogenes]|nr:hypothetical protein [Rhizobium rhizogenes]NTJ77412.1 hypothetical protein [Rhizobium rhizogenes]